MSAARPLFLSLLLIGCAAPDDLRVVSQSGDKIVLSWTLNPRTLDEIERLIAAGLQRSYRHFNVKISPDVNFDLELCRTVKRLVPDGLLWADANGGYDVETALTIAPKLADIGVAVFEQPVAANRLSGFARLKKQGALPIIMDDVLVNFDPVRAREVAREVAGVAERRQVLVFTCHPTTRDLLLEHAPGARVLELGGRALASPREALRESA